MFEVNSATGSSPIGAAAAERLEFSTLTWLCAAIKTTAGVFYLVDEDLGQSHFLTYNVDLSFHRRYLKQLYQLDPLHPRHFGPLDAPVVTLSDTVCLRTQNDYYRSFIAPQGIHEVVEVFFRRADRIVAGISMLKYWRGAPLSVEDVLLLRKVHPLIESYLTAVLPSCPVRQESGQEGFTDRERQALALIKDGLSNKEIARRLDISLSTVKTHIRSILSKTGTRSRATLLSKLFWH